MASKGKYAPPAAQKEEGIPDEEQVEQKDFTPSRGLTTSEAEALLKQWGRNELEEHHKPKWLIFLEQLKEPMPIMIWLAAFTEASIQNWPDMGILLAIQFINASISFYEITKAGDAVAALKASLKPLATVKRDGAWENIDAGGVVPGDLVLLASGSAIPADCIVNEGTIEVDQAALTGESLPVTMYKGSSCKMGSNVVRGEVEGTVEYTGSNTFFGKTASLLQGDDELGNLQKVLLRIVIVLVILSFTFSGIVFGWLLGSGEGLTETISFTVVLIVASIPVAIEIVCTTTLALGSKELSKHGAIVTRLAAIEDMAGMTMLCSDKTGTLTMNKMMIQEETPIYKKGESQYTLLRYAAMAAKWKEPPRDALDTLTLNAVDMPSMDAVEALAFMPFDPIVKRTEGTVREKATGKTYKTSKGAPHVILKLVVASSSNQAANEAITKAVEDDVHSFGLRGIRTLAVAKTNEKEEWEFLGMLTFLDPPRPDTKQTIDDAIKYGVAVKMITGDHLLIARETARVLGMGNYIKSGTAMPLLDPETKKKPPNLANDYGDQCLAVDGFAQVFPEHKYLIVECLRELGYKTGMTGDGVNDAPALKRADVGVAVQGSTDAARAAADIVLTQPGLSTIVNGILISRRIFVRIKNFLTYRIAATLQLLCFFFIAVLAFKPNNFMPEDWKTDPDFPDSHEWPDFFHMPVLMLMLITLLNDGTLIAIGYDRVEARETPEKWNLPVLYTVSSVLAAVACISSLLLLWALLDSWNNGLFGGLSYGQITTCIYLKVSISDFLTLFSARTNETWFWTTAPAPILLGAGTLALTLSTIIACSWPTTYPDGVYTMGLARRKPYELPVYIWLYCIGWWFVQDAAKVATFYVLKKYNIFGYNDTGKLVLPESAVRYINDNKEKDMSSLKH
mmetsp:Transcript_19959/g.33403  ORF Transcript_19959/g.33403 Transcript_19959/m.33403 type:complete len:906 (+) Transcript_19959:83-2800(+)